MKYFLIAGEASGDLHASRLIEQLRQADPQAQFRCYGGDHMQQAGATLLCHYRDLAFMGFIPVITHLPTILRGLRHCKQAIVDWQPDAVILIDYAGFNLKIARFVKQHANRPVLYYIPPKIWAWKEGRIKQLRAYADRLYCIIPFEEDYYAITHSYGVSYVGNPTVDEVAAYQAQHGPARSDGHTIAVLPGSRLQEVTDNLRIMLRGIAPVAARHDCRIVVAGARSLSPEVYRRIISRLPVPADRITVVHDDTYGLLSHAAAAVVTSGTATLETALFGVPQVVCYYTRFGRILSLLRRIFLKVPYISLVNLVTARDTVAELVAHHMTAANVARELEAILTNSPETQRMRRDYADMRERLGQPGCAQRAAREMIELIRTYDPSCTVRDNTLPPLCEHPVPNAEQFNHNPFTRLLRKIFFLL